MSDKYLRTKEIAKRWNTSTRQVHEAVHRGDLKAVRFNKRLWRFHPEDVAEAERKMGRG